MRLPVLSCVLAALCMHGHAADAPANNTPAAPTAAFLAQASPAPEATRAGTLRAVQGRVQIGAEGATPRMARTGEAVDRSERILTDAGGGASIVLRDGTTLVLGPSSSLELRDFQFDSTSHQGSMWMSLLRGSLRMVTGLIGGRQPDAVRLQARTVTVGIRGTDFIVALEEQ